MRRKILLFLIWKILCLFFLEDIIFFINEKFIKNYK